MISPGLSVGYEANKVPIVAKQKAVSTTPAIKGITFTGTVQKTTSPIAKGTDAATIL